jgi:hypothetical protein
MYEPHTIAAITALATIDKTATDADKDALQSVLTGRRASSQAVASFREAASALGVSLPGLRKLIKRGRLKTVPGSGSRALGVARQSLDAFCA